MNGINAMLTYRAMLLGAPRKSSLSGRVCSIVTVCTWLVWITLAYALAN
jgi:hypothetical protein